MKRFTLLLLLLIPTMTFGQLGVDFHVSNIPFFGVNYEFIERLRPEVRVGTDTFFEDISVEGVVTFDIINKTDYEFYLGLGFRSEDFAGLVLPVGFNFYPLEEKKFGFLIELTPIIGDSDILRGSLGIRYKFTPEQP